MDYREEMNMQRSKWGDFDIKLQIVSMVLSIIGS